MKRNNIIPALCVLMLFASVFFASAANEARPVLPVKPLQPEMNKPQEKMPALPPVSQTPENVYNYNPLGKPDPFRPFVDVEVSAVKKSKEASKESIFPLQRAEVESFKLVGIIGDQMRRLAVVEDASRKHYPIFVGTRIGTHDGKVTEIFADRVAVDELDGKKTRRIILKLRKNI